MKTKVLMFICLFAAILSSKSFSQGKRQGPGRCSVSGTVLDAATNSPIEYASVVLFKAADSSMANGSVTDKNGRFSVEGLQAGQYFAKFTFIGYSSKRLNKLMLSPKQPELKIGTLLLKPSTLKMKDVVVTSQRDMVTNSIDKQVVSVDKNIAAAGGNAADVLQNVPSVSVDATGTISLRGNSNLNILIDGKPSGLSGVSSGDVLTEIPASSIESIEIITNPSAKFDPEGTSGIINIILKKKANLGLNGIISGNAGTGNKFNGTMNLNYRREGFNLFGNVDSRIFNASGTSTENRITSYGLQDSFLDQSSVSDNHRNMKGFKFGIDYFLNDFNTITASVQKRIMSFSGFTITDNFSRDQDSLRSAFSRLNESSRDVHASDYTLSYKKTYDLKGEELTADLIYSNNEMDGDVTNGQSYWVPSVSKSKNRQDGTNTNKMYVVQSNYVLPAEESGRFEAGFRSSYKNQNMNYDYSDFSDSLDSWLSDPSRRNHFNYKEQIHAVYAIYAGVFGPFKYQAGLRAEEALTKSHLELTDESYDNNYFSLYPSAYLMQELGDGHEIQLSYTRRVDRPRNRQLNPFVDYSDPLNIEQGNPHLKPQFTNSYQAGYSKVWGNSSLSLDGFYKSTNGVISDVSRLLGGGVTMTTPENLSKYENYGLEFNASTSLFEFWKLNWSYSYFRNQYHADQQSSDVSSSGTSWMSKLNSTMGLPEDISLQIIGNYQAPSIQAQEHRKASYFADLAVKKDFLDGALSLNLRVSDIFNTRTRDSDVIGQNFHFTLHNKRDSRFVFLGLTYKLNNFIQKNHKASEEGDQEDFQQ